MENEDIVHFNENKMKDFYYWEILSFPVGFLFSRCYKFPGKTGNIIVFPGIPGNSREITLSVFKQKYTQSTNL